MTKKTRKKKLSRKNSNSNQQICEIFFQKSGFHSDLVQEIGFFFRFFLNFITTYGEAYVQKGVNLGGKF